MTGTQVGQPDGVTGIGQRLRLAREQAGLTVAEVGTRLKMPTRAVEALEAEDWARLGAPVFVRGQLRSYAKLLGMPADAIADSAAARVAPTAELVAHTYTPRARIVADNLARKLVYVVLTAAIAVPVWLATQSHLDRSVLDTVSLESAPALPAIGESASPEPAAVPQPIVASMAPSLPRQAAPAGDLVVTFSGESWVRITGADGAVLEQALVPAGSTRAFTAGQLGQAVLGNATGVAITSRGAPVDLTPFIRANVVRFTVSSDGSLQPVER